MATTTKRYLDLEGLRYVLGKQTYTKPAETGKFVTGLSQTNGKVTATWADLTAADVPAIGSPTAFSTTSALEGKVATFAHTITRDAGEALTADIKLGVTGDLTIARNAENGQITIGYTAAVVENPVLGVVTDSWLTLDGTTKLLNIDTTKIKADSNGAATMLASKEYVDEKVRETVTSAVTYKGTTATLPAGTPVNGDMYKVVGDGFAVGGETAKAGDTIIYYKPTDAATGEWQRIPSGDDDVVTTFGEQTGDITVNSGSTALGDVNFAMDGKKLTGTVAGLSDALDGKQDKFDDGSATIASKTIEGKVTLKAGIKQTKGAIANNTDTDITLEKVATTGKAEDVKLDAIEGVTSTDVQAAIAELHTAVTSAAAAGVQSIDDKTGAIKLDKTSTADGSVKFAWDTTDEKLLKATVTLPTADATIVTAEEDPAKYEGAATTKVTIKTVVKETNGEIAAGADDVVMQTITSAEIDALFEA